MISLIFFIAFIFLTGIIICRSIISPNRFEIILPAGLILGLTIFVFTLNIVSFIFKGPTGIIISYGLSILPGLIFLFKQKIKIKFVFSSLNYKFLILWFISVVSWGVFIFWKATYALIGSDTNLYYAIAHSFIKGNFPFLTPWQPDIPLSYHTGTSLLLGAFYFFTGLSFQFLHLFFAAIFIFCSVQIIIWLINRPATIINFILVNLTAAIAFISFGFIYITRPVFPLQLPSFANINQLVIWLRNLPTVNQAIEVYGAPINLDALIYFIFHAFGLSIFLSLLALLVNFKKEKPLIGWVMVCIGLSVLALVNESIFVAVFPAIFLGIFLIEWKEGRLFKNLKILVLLLILTVFIVALQGGIISASINPSSNIEPSALIFPKKEDVKDDFLGYHLGQEFSRLLPEKQEWLPLRWFHPGIYYLLALGFLAALFIKGGFIYQLLLRILFVAGLVSLVAYNVIVPKFVVANGNRFLSFSFLLFSLLLCFSLIPIFDKIQKNFTKKLIFIVFLGWVFIPTVLPPLALLSKNRFGVEKLVPELMQISEGMLWLKKNANFNKRVVVLDRNTPHPSGQARALVEAGIFAPVFYGNFRVFTIEPSPEYTDIAYYLSPDALRKMKVDFLLIDNIYFETLSQKRRQQLEDYRFFEKVFDNSAIFPEWEKIFKIKDEYLENGGEMGGTFREMLDTLPFNGKIYIGNEEEFKPAFLRRPLIFSLRDKEIYFKPQSGVYLNVETNINWHPLEEGGSFDYLVLGKDIKAETICQCRAKLIWTGLNGAVTVWKRE